MGCFLLLVAVVVVIVLVYPKIKKSADAQRKALLEAAQREQEAAQRVREAAASELEAAKSAYQQKLNALAQDPANTSLRQSALQFGRTYAELSRRQIGSNRTMFDEIALMNDINVACGAARQDPSREPETPPRPAAVPVEERLAKLKSLRDQGLIDEEEYRQKREKILDEV